MKKQICVLLTILTVILSLLTIFTSCDKSTADVTTPIETEAITTPEATTESVGDTSAEHTETSKTEESQIALETTETPHTHVWKEWHTLKRATCTESGEQERV